MRQGSLFDDDPGRISGLLPAMARIIAQALNRVDAEERWRKQQEGGKR